MRRFPNVSATNSVPNFRVCWWFGSTKMINFVATRPSHTLEMGTKLVPAMSENLHILTQLSARENFITSNNTSILIWNIPHYTAILSDVVVIILSSIVVLTPNAQFLDCATIAFSEGYNTTKRHIWISASWNLLRWSHNSVHCHHTSRCCSQPYIYYKLLMLFLWSVMIFLKGLTHFPCVNFIGETYPQIFPL
jgi:hypothetical protein